MNRFLLSPALAITLNIAVVLLSILGVAMLGSNVSVSNPAKGILPLLAPGLTIWFHSSATPHKALAAFAVGANSLVFLVGVPFIIVISSYSGGETTQLMWLTLFVAYFVLVPLISALSILARWPTTPRSVAVAAKDDADSTS